jgi:hypothetical protein
MAAGVTVHQDRFEDFRRAFEISTRERVNDEILTPKLHLDAELPVEEVSLSLLEQQELLEPCGMGNSQPVFATRMVTPAAAPRCLGQASPADFRATRLVQAIYFRGTEEELPCPPGTSRSPSNAMVHGRLEAQMQILGIRSADCRAKGIFERLDAQKTPETCSANYFAAVEVLLAT